MNKTTKNILAAIPLVIGLSGPAAAEISDPSSTDGGGSGAIDSLLNQYSGLTPGDSGGGDPTTQAVTAGQRYSAFTGSVGTMTSYFTIMGVDKTSPNEPLVQQGGSVGSSSDSGSTTTGSGADVSSYGSVTASPTAIAAVTSTHAIQDSLVSAVATSLAPSSSGGNSSATFTPAAETVTTATPEPPLTPAPIPPAAMLLGSGLVALASLRKRNKDALTG